MSSGWWKSIRLAAAIVALFLASGVRAAGIPAWLPRYEIDIDLDTAGKKARVLERATWTNHSQQIVRELVFNAHSRYIVPDADVGLTAKMLEILRMQPSESLGETEPACDIRSITLAPVLVPTGGPSPAPIPLPFRYEGDTKTALVVPLPQPLKPGESVTVQLDIVMKLPPKQGRWGQWKDVTFLSNWLPVFAVFEEPKPIPDRPGPESCWRPTPFVPWHQPFYNEAGIYHVRAVVPCGQEVACTGTIAAEKILDDGRRLLDIEAIGVRDFALLCSPRYRKFTGVVAAGNGVPHPIQLEVLAFPEHEHYARVMLGIAAQALSTYSRWFGPYPYPKFTIAEAYFGWNGNECSTLVMIDERVFGMPHVAECYVEYLVSHEICHQWWYNLIGTNGYCETFMDEAMATYFSHRLLNQKYGCNNNMLTFPKALEWLPNIRREDYRAYSLLGTLRRGENGPCVQEIPKFEHIVNLFSMCYDKGSRIVGTIEERLGETAFLDFAHVLYRKYQYRILRVADFQHELEEFTGHSWDVFFRDWLYGKGVTDWAVENVELQPPPECCAVTLLDRIRGRSKKGGACDGQTRPTWKATVWLSQKSEVTEQTTLGFVMPGCPGYSIRVPIIPGAKPYETDTPAAKVVNETPNRVRVEVLLPDKPEQIAVDPDQVLVDAHPSNNFWKPEVRWRFTPLYTFLEETDLTNSYDRWNVIGGPWVNRAAYANPWFPLATLVGVRLGAYRTQEFSGGVYAAYRTEYRDAVAGIDALWDHWPGDHYQVGLNAERRLSTIYQGDQDAMRAVGFGRYVFQYGDSLYLPPMHYLEAYASYQDNFLPFASQQDVPGGERPLRYSAGGLHYRIDYRTPYWDPEGGFLADLLYECGVADLDRREGMHKLAADLATVKYVPDIAEWMDAMPNLRESLRPFLTWLADTRVAVRAFGAVGLPSRGEWFTMGGEERVRGFDLAQRQGSAVWVGSAEWRVPLAKGLTWDCCDHIIGLRNVYAAAFYDVGNTYLNGHQVAPIAHSIGAGLRLDVSWFSFIERTMIRLDVAKVVNADTPVQVWFGLQHPF